MCNYGFQPEALIRAFLDTFQGHLVLQNFFCALQKLFLQIQRIPPLDVEKTFLKINFYQSHVMAFGLKIPKWYNTLVLKIFFQIFFQKIGKNNLKNIFDQIFTKNICNSQVLYHFGIVRPNSITWL